MPVSEVAGCKESRVAQRGSFRFVPARWDLMPTAVKSDATSLRPVREPTQGSEAGKRAPSTPVAEHVCSECGELYSGQHVCSPAPATNLSPFMAPMNRAGYLGTREQIQAELDAMAFSIRAFHLKQPDQIMRECQGYSARLTELCVLLHRVEALDRQYTRVRTSQVERWLTELDRQFKIASRLVEVARQDLELLK